MHPIKGNYLNDIGSLLEYERLWGRNAFMSVSELARRMAAVERQNNTAIPDTYLEGLVSYNIDGKFTTLADLMCGMPVEMANEYLTLQGGRLYVKGEMFEEWMEHIISIPPSFFIAGYWLKAFSLSLLQSKSEVNRFVKTHLSAFAYTTMLHPFLPELKYWVEQTDGLHDLHVHLNGTTETDAIWTYMLHHQDEAINDFLKIYKKQSSIRKLAEQTFPGFTPIKLQTLLNHAYQLKQDMLTMVAMMEHRSRVQCLKINYLWKNFSSNTGYGPFIGEILFILIVFAELRKTNNSVLAGKLHHYLLIKGVVHRFCVQQKSQVGFPQFQMLTDNSFREGIEKTYEQRFLQLAGSDNCVHTGLIEGRFSPKATALKNYQLLLNIETGFKKAVSILRQKRKIKNAENMNLALVAHFIKKPETNKTKKVEIRHHFLRKELRKKAIALSEVMNTKLGRRLIVGIDAAASELDAGPEVFSPAFQYLSRHGVRHITYHAGEDFRHLLSGIRAVLEAVVFLRMKAGDRIGHGTALGIDPFLWKERVNGVCYVHRGEWLDDLVLVWHLIRTDENASSLISVLPRIESAIAELTIQVYGTIIHPAVLRKAWQLRSYDPDFLFGLKSRQEVLALYDYEELLSCEKNMSDRFVESVLRKYHAPSQGSTLSQYRNAYDELIEIKIGQLLSCDQLNTVQDIVLDMVSKQGIVIESLPSSNLRISYYQNFDEYHIGRWTEAERTNGSIPAVVFGSDDPGIFMTNIYNEYARVYCYLSRKSMPSVERLDMMKKVRESSEIYKFYGND